MLPETFNMQIYIKAHRYKYFSKMGSYCIYYFLIYFLFFLPNQKKKDKHLPTSINIFFQFCHSFTQKSPQKWGLLWPLNLKLNSYACIYIHTHSPQWITFLYGIHHLLTYYIILNFLFLLLEHKQHENRDLHLCSLYLRARNCA